MMRKQQQWESELDIVASGAESCFARWLVAAVEEQAACFWTIY